MTNDEAVKVLNEIRDGVALQGQAKALREQIARIDEAFDLACAALLTSGNGKVEPEPATVP